MASSSSFNPFWRPLRGRRNTVLFLIGCLALITGVLLTSYLSPRPSTTSTKVSRGDRKALIRLPQSSGRSQEDILVSGTSADSNRKASRGPADVRGEGVSINSYTRQQLSETAWQAINTQRLAWCQQSPNFTKVPEGAPFYDVAIRCGSGFDVKQFIVPTDQLPPAFADLIDSVPSPQATP